MVEIKKLEPDDITEYVIDQINVLIYQLFGCKYPDRRQTGAHMYSVVQDLHKMDNERGTIFTAWIDDKLVGMCSLYIVDMLSRRTVFYEEMVVDEFYRGHGISHHLDAAVIQFAKDHDVDAIELVVPIAAVPVQRLHLKSGFTFRNQLSMGMTLKRWT